MTTLRAYVQGGDPLFRTAVVLWYGAVGPWAAFNAARYWRGQTAGRIID